MANQTNLTDNLSNDNDTNEVTMDSQIVQLFHLYTQEGGSPRITEFKRYIDNLIKSEIKPLCGRSGKSPDGDDWRSNLKTRFGGRGAKWVKVSIEEITPTLNNISNELDVTDYTNFINIAGYAWIRYSAPRIYNATQCAAFEVRVGGSTIDHPKQLHYISVDNLDSTIESLQGTPHSMKLEVIAQPKQEDPAEEITEDTEITEDEEDQDNISEEVITEEDEIEQLNQLIQEVEQEAAIAENEIDDEDLDDIFADFGND